MAERPGFVSARLYPARGGVDPTEYIHVAHWSHAHLLAAAQSDPEIQQIQAEVKKLVVFLHRVLCDAPIEEVVPLCDLPHDQLHLHAINRSGADPELVRSV